MMNEKSPIPIGLPERKTLEALSGEVFNPREVTDWRTDSGVKSLLV